MSTKGTFVGPNSWPLTCLILVVFCLGIVCGGFLGLRISYNESQTSLEYRELFKE